MIRSIFRLSLALGLLGIFLNTGQFASAQASGVTQITGVVQDTQRRPVSGAQVRVSGPVSKTTRTAEDGSFVFLGLPSGIYRLDISKGGFNSATQDGIVTAAGSTTRLTFALQAASLTSLTVIGSVSVNVHNSANTINTTPASIVDVPATTFTDQGQLQLNQVLNEEPGITIGAALTGFATNQGGNAASPLSFGVPSIRGGLPYETESLIDGHAVSLGQNGYFSPSVLSPYELQNVEIVKGPGAISPSINYAINGTVNYRTLEPTLKPQESVDLGMDQYGGNVANFRATGTLPGGRLSYAFDYVVQGTQGDDRGLDVPVWLLGGQAVNGTPINGLGGFGVGPPPANQLKENVLGNASLEMQSVLCCPQIPMNFYQRNELGKIRYAFDPATTLTVTWLGAQTNGSTFQTVLRPCLNSTFLPTAGYTGALQSGPLPIFVPFNYGTNLQETNLFETEFHMPIGNSATLLLRQYTSSIQNFAGGPGDSGPTAAPANYSLTGAVYGDIYYTSSPNTPVIFNGQTATLDSGNIYSEARSYNKLNGYTAEIDKQVGNDLLSLSYDEEKTSTYATAAGLGYFAVTVPGGSSQTFQSVMGRFQFELGQRLNGTLSDNFGSYTDIYSQDSGVSFLSATHTYEAPRLSLTWRPNANQSVRGSAGFSVAPPYLGLLNNNGLVLAGGPPLYFTGTANSGDVLPETAFGFDLGLDTRLHSPFTVLSADVYQTLLHGQFLTSTTEQGVYTCSNPVTCLNYLIYPGVTAPFYVTKTGNLGHSEYEGIELSLHRTPPVGWGYRIQGSLMRAFAYDLPAGFYNTPLGPNTTNLGILPNINYQGSCSSAQTISPASIPYAMGYGEINYRGHNGAYFLAGVTYFGPNNSYQEPAFEIVTASYTQPLTQRISLQLSVYNLTNAYPQLYGEYNGSPIYSPYVNGYVGGNFANVVGPSTARLTLHMNL